MGAYVNMAARRESQNQNPRTPATALWRGFDLHGATARFAHRCAGAGLVLSLPAKFRLAHPIFSSPAIGRGSPGLERGPQRAGARRVSLSPRVSESDSAATLDCA